MGQFGGTQRDEVETPGQRSLYFKPDSPERLFGRLERVEESQFKDSAGKMGKQLVFSGGIVLLGPRFVDGYRFERKIVPVSANLRDRVRESDAGKLVMVEFMAMKQGTKMFGVEVDVPSANLQRIIARSNLAAAIPYEPRAIPTSSEAGPGLDVDDDREYEDLPF